jgi:hypothetical protein
MCGDNFRHPYGMRFHILDPYPALKRRAIFRRPPDANLDPHSAADQQIQQCITPGVVEAQCP